MHSRWDVDPPTRPAAHLQLRAHFLAAREAWGTRHRDLQIEHQQLAARGQALRAARTTLPASTYQQQRARLQADRTAFVTAVRSLRHDAAHLRADLRPRHAQRPDARDETPLVHEPAAVTAAGTPSTPVRPARRPRWSAPPRLASTSRPDQRTGARARRSRNDLEVLLTIANETVALHTSDALLDRILAHLGQIVDFDVAAIATLTETTLTIQACRTRLPSPDLRGRTCSVWSVPAIERLLRTREPLLVDDVQLDIQRLRSIEAALGCAVPGRAALAVPLIVNGRTIGVLALLHQVAGYYRRAELARLQSFANQVTIAIHHGWLDERDKQAAMLDERHRLARELHDAVTQTLYSASLIAEALPQTWQHAPPIAMKGVEQLRLLTRTALAELRSLLIELRPTALTEKPLGDLLGLLCTATGGRIGVPIRLDVRSACPLPADVQIALYRLAQEALNNVVKHADASQVWVTLACRRAEVMLAIADDGRGFEPSQVAPASFGLQSMRERAEEIGARLQIKSRVNKGTIVAVEWRPRPTAPSPPADAAETTERAPTA